MMSLVWMLIWLLQIISGSRGELEPIPDDFEKRQGPSWTAVSELPPPHNLSLKSSHWTYVLEWQPGAGTAAGAHYHVSIRTDMETSWEPVAGCEHVQLLVCNLTDVLDPRESYFVQVIAKQGALTSAPAVYTGFTPIKDSKLILPKLTVRSCGKNLCVDLHPPAEHRREIYNELNYKLMIQSNSADKVMFKHMRSLGTLPVEDLAPTRQYCFSVCILDTEMSQESDYSQPMCAITPGIHNADHWLSSVACLLPICFVVVMVFLVMTGFIPLRRHPQPLVMSSIRHMEEVALVTPWSVSLTSLFSVKPTADDKRSNCSSDASDTDSESENHDGHRDYRRCVCTNLLSSSSSVLSESEPQSSVSSNQSSHFTPRPPVVPSVETRSTNSDDHTDCASQQCEDSHHVNLSTLTFALHGDEEEEQEEEDRSHADLPDMAIESDTEDTSGQLSFSADVNVDDSEEEVSAYMGRPSAYVPTNRL